MNSNGRGRRRRQVYVGPGVLLLLVVIVVAVLAGVFLWGRGGEETSGNDSAQVSGQDDQQTDGTDNSQTDDQQTDADEPKGVVTSTGVNCTLMDLGENAYEFENKTSVVMVIGVNGVGKTTTIGKLAGKLKGQGKKVILAAADTFRAAAGEQLKEWAGRAQAELIGGQEGSDPAAVVYDAVAAAKARHADVLLCDTAGRLHNKKNLMEELRKMNRIIDREFPEAFRETLVVLDATTGQNALQQAKEFNEVADITGIILTKMDGTAKGGIAVAIQAELGIPVKYIGVGETIDDLQKFDADTFVNALFTTDSKEKED